MKKKIALLVALTAMASAVFAQGGSEAAGGKKAVDFPKKNITMICPWAAGGGTDAVLRALCGAAEKYLGVGITVENKTGGAGAIGHAAIKNAKPDGYTVGMVTFELNSLPQQGLIDFTYADFDPLIRVNSDAAALTVKADAPYNTVQEFIDYCKANPGKVSIGNSAPGSVWHIGAGLLADSAGIDVKHVAFEGAASAVTALAGGHIQAVTVSIAEVKSQLDAGNLKCLGVMDENRPASYPDIKTFKEQGFDINYGTWRGLALPKGVDPEIKQILVDAFTKACQDKQFTDAAANLNLNVAYLDSDDFAAFLKSNFEDVTKTMKALGLAE